VKDNRPNNDIKSLGSRFRLNVLAGSQKRATTNRKGDDRAPVITKKKFRRHLHVTIVSIFCLYWDKRCPISIGTNNNLSGPSDVESKATPRTQ
jgi:hypothetical protein